MARLSELKQLQGCRPVKLISKNQPIISYHKLLFILGFCAIIIHVPLTNTWLILDCSISFLS